MASDQCSNMAPKEGRDDNHITKPKPSQCHSLKSISTRLKRKGKLTRNSSRLLDKLRKRLPKRRTEEPRKIFRESDMERALYRWFSRQTTNCSSIANKPSIDDIFRKAILLSKRLGADDMDLKVINEKWVHSWLKKFGAYDIIIKNEPVLEKKDVTLDSLLQGYNDDQIYSGFGFEFDWTSLPDRNLIKKCTEDRVWLLMAGNKTGRHRTRMLIIGKEWRPDCLKHVNMLSQPVVYAGGGVGRLTPDLFSWWFHREFAPAALVLNEAGAVLVMDKADYLPCPSECVTADGKVKLVIYNPENCSNIKIDQSVLRCELKTRYGMLLLQTLSVEQPRWLSLTHYLRDFSLKEAFPLLHRAWLNVRPESFARCWNFESTTVQVEEDKMLLLELQWLAHDVGFEVTDEDVRIWSSCDFDLHQEPLKTEPRDESRVVGIGDAVVPTASEAASHLAKALLWMETEPIEPSYLLVLRDIIAIAKQACRNVFND